MASLTSAYKLQNNTRSIPDTPQLQIGTSLWIHIITITATSGLLFPLLIILKTLRQSWFIVCIAITVITTGVGVIATYFQRNGSYLSTHTTLGYFVILLLTGYFSTYIWKSNSSTRTVHTNKTFTIFQQIIFFLIALLLYICIVLGVISL